MSQYVSCPYCNGTGSIERSELDRLTAQVKDLTEALRPFAEFGISIEDGETDVIDHDMLLRVTDCFAKPDFMRARSVIEAEIKEK